MAEFKEFELWLKFETPLEYGWFHLKLYSMFEDFSQRSIETGILGFETRLNSLTSEFRLRFPCREKLTCFCV